VLTSPYQLSGAGIFFLGADANRDRLVNLADFNILASRFGTSIGPNQRTAFGLKPIGKLRQADGDEQGALLALLE
jgi:hypothetical protein